MDVPESHMKDKFECLLVCVCVEGVCLSVDKFTSTSFFTFQVHVYLF